MIKKNILPPNPVETLNGMAIHSSICTSTKQTPKITVITIQTPAENALSLSMLLWACETVTPDLSNTTEIHTGIPSKSIVTHDSLHPSSTNIKALIRHPRKKKVSDAINKITPPATTSTLFAPKASLPTISPSSMYHPPKAHSATTAHQTVGSPISIQALTIAMKTASPVNIGIILNNIQ